MLTCLETMKALLNAQPRCCACEKDYVVIFTIERWGLCEKCWELVPAGDFPPVIDMRTAVYNALAVIAREESRFNNREPSP